MHRTLVIGVGNEHRRDDGAGLHVARGIAARGLAGVTVREARSVLGSWDGFERVYVVDAVMSGSEPGTVHRVDARREALPAGMFQRASHAFGVADAVELARRLGRLPAVLVIYGIEGRDLGTGRGLSREVKRAAAEAVERLLAEIAPMELSR